MSRSSCWSIVEEFFFILYLQLKQRESYIFFVKDYGCPKSTFTMPKKTFDKISAWHKIALKSGVYLGHEGNQKESIIYNPCFNMFWFSITHIYLSLKICFFFKTLQLLCTSVCNPCLARDIVGGEVGGEWK